jgi:nitrogen-specific signal transduction histidine kinase
MISGSSLAHDIVGDISRDGRLLRGDPQLILLHHRAGGVDGSKFAIPALAALADLALRLKMRLSRAVRLIDGDENIELWVEVTPLSDVAHISISSWRALNVREFDFSTSDEFSQNTVSAFVFDASFRLTKATGVFAENLSRTDFGLLVDDFLAKWLENSVPVKTIVEAVRGHLPFAAMPVSLRFTEKSCAMSGLIQTGVAGYQLHVTAVDAPVVTGVEKSDTGSAGALFGQQLVPVLRQPLGRIIANAETIGSELQGPIRENYALYAKDIASAARHLMTLVDDLSDLEAVEREDLVTARDHIELGDVARRVAGLLALKAADHSIRITTPSEDQTVPAVAEFRRVLQILLNLVTNAIHYSPDGTEIFIDIANIDGTACVMVSDQGAGILPDDREKIFAKFERLGQSGDGGSGLGLYISRRLARTMGGDLTVDDATKGGAKFTLRLPSQ